MLGDWLFYKCHIEVRYVYYFVLCKNNWRILLISAANELLATLLAGACTLEFPLSISFSSQIMVISKDSALEIIF